MKEVVDFLIGHSWVALALLLIFFCTIVLVLVLIYRHWGVFSSIMDFSKNVPIMLKNQDELKNQHIFISDQVKKIAAETIPNGSNNIRIISDNISEIKDTVTKIIHYQEVSNLELEARLEVDKVPTFKCDANGMCTFANSSLCYLFGTTQEHMTGQGWGSFILFKEQPRVFANWQRFIDSNGSEIEDSYPIRTSSGIKKIRYKAISKFGKDGKRLFVIGTAWDNNKRTKEDLECLFDMADVLKKTSVWEEIQNEINKA